MVGIPAAATVRHFICQQQSIDWEDPGQDRGDLPAVSDWEIGVEMSPATF
jgi:hypothetical protein